MKKRRTSRDYDGDEPTTCSFADVVPSVMQMIISNYSDRPDLVMKGWEEVVGDRIGPMTLATSFIEGVLSVKVKNSTCFYNLIIRKGALLEDLQQKFPKTKVKDIQFGLS